MVNKFKIKDRVLDQKSKCFIIAEAGVNHNGNIDKAKELIEIAKSSGADAVKFQLFNAKEQISKFAYNAPYQRIGSGKKTMLEMAKGYDFPWEKHKDLADYSKKVGIIYMSSCFDVKAVDFFIDELGGDCIKVGSGEITNYPLLRYIENRGLPIILSTGMCTLKDIKGALEQLKRNHSIALLHCISSYPTKSNEVNIKAIQTLKAEFNLLTGFSDHTLTDIASIAAIAVGAKIIEKHFTIDKKLPGPDHSLSLDPEELKEFVGKIRKAEIILGDGVKNPTENEIEMRKYSRRGLVAATHINQGEILSYNNITLKRPSTGIDARELDDVVGKRIKLSVKPDEIITHEMLGRIE